MKENTGKKRRSVMRQFIDTTYQIAQEESFESITVRRLAKDTHYNSSTLYYYFESVEHLMTYVAVKYLNGFFSEQRYIEENYIHTLDKFLKTWDSFIKYAFQYPEQFYMLFYGEHSHKLSQILEIYQELYPSELIPHLKSFPLIKDLKKNRNMPLLDICIAHGHIKAQSRTKLIELIDIVFKGLLLKAKEEKDEDNIQDMKSRMLEYIILFLKSYKTPIGCPHTIVLD